MASSRRSGVLEFAVLGLLHDAPMHGYELRKRLNGVLGSFRAPSRYGTLYPALKTLSPGADQRGAAGRRARRPLASGRRAEIVYELTAEGKERFPELLDAAGPGAWEDAGFDVHFAFFAGTDQPTWLRILEGRRTGWRSGWTVCMASMARNRERLDAYTRSCSARPRAAEREVRWLSELIASGHTDGAPGPRPARYPTGVPGPGRVAREAAGQKEHPDGFHSRRHRRRRQLRLVPGAGRRYYRDADPADRVPGLMHVQFGDYHVRDLEFVAAFDVDAKKVGRDLAEAIVARENNTIKFADVPPWACPLQRGPTLDGLGKYYREMFEETDEPPVDVVAMLREARADVLICYLPVGPRRPRSSTRSAPSMPGSRSSTRCRCSSPGPGVGGRSSRRRRPDRRRRHQEPGRRDHHAPGPDQAVRGPRRHRRPDVPAERRRQHGLHEHARA